MATNKAIYQRHKVSDIIETARSLTLYREYSDMKFPLVSYLDMINSVTAERLDLFARVGRYLDYDIRRDRRSGDWYEGDVNLNARYGVEGV